MKHGDHYLMDRKLCRWDDFDGVLAQMVGKRGGSVQKNVQGAYPVEGQIQCRCVSFPVASVAEIIKHAKVV
jgi:hypothetical protein